MSYIHAIILAIIEGLTEFLPVSSTGHMVLASSIMGIEKSEFTKLFEVVIQFGAILAIVVLYWKRFFQDFDFYLKLLVAFIPAAILGATFYKHIKEVMGSPLTIAVVLLIGGIIMLFVDKMFERNESFSPVSQKMDYKKALTIGGFQVLAMIFPGLSRSAATIFGGLTQGLNRKNAAEFSFFLAVPTMAAASSYESYKYYKNVKIGAEGFHALTGSEIGMLAMGNIVAFIVAMIAVRTFINFFTEKGFKIFGYYRIALGLLVLVLWYSGFKMFVD